MIRALIYLIIILIGLCVSPFLVGSKGYLYLAIDDYQIETSVVFAVVAIIIFYSLLQLAESIVIFVINLLMSSRYLPDRWRKKAAKKHTLNGAIALAAEDWPAAEKAMIKGAEKGELPTLNWLAAARAAQQQNRSEACSLYLDKAAEEPRAAQAVGTIRTRYLLEQGELEQAGNELEKLAPTSKSSAPIIKLAMELYQAQSNWTELKRLLPIIKKKQLLNQADFAALTQRTNTKLLESATNTNEQELDKCWYWLSRAERKQAENIALYAIGLNKFDRRKEAIKLLISSVKSAPSPILFTTIPEVLMATDVDARKQLLSLEAQFEGNGEYPACIAKLFEQNHDLQNAKLWWQKACFQDANQENLLSLAEILEQSGEVNRALQSHKKAMVN